MNGGCVAIRREINRPYAGIRSWRIFLTPEAISRRAWHGRQSSAAAWSVSYLNKRGIFVGEISYGVLTRRIIIIAAESENRYA